MRQGSGEEIPFLLMWQAGLGIGIYRAATRQASAIVAP
jgi:hypothetical protein